MVKSTLITTATLFMLSLATAAFAAASTVKINVGAAPDFSDLIAKYEAAQNAKDLEGTIALFAEDAVVSVPFGAEPGEGTFVGTAQIRVFYSTFFASLVSLTETVISKPYFQNGDTVAYLKNLNMTAKAAPDHPIDFPVMQYFTFDLSTRLITTMSALYNTPSVGNQTTVNCAAAVMQYEATQNARDADSSAALFDPLGIVFMPLGSAPIVGRYNILQAYDAFFKSTGSLRETVVGGSAGIYGSGTACGYIKTLDGTWANGAKFSFPAFVMINYNAPAEPGSREPGLIRAMALLWTTGA